MRSIDYGKGNFSVILFKGKTTLAFAVITVDGDLGVGGELQNLIKGMIYYCGSQTFRELYSLCKSLWGKG